jgi:hypothetical protein
MRRIRFGMAAILVSPVLLLSSCAGSVPDKYVIENEPASVEKIAGSDRARVILTDRAAKRLGVQTTRVKRAPGGLVVPSAALFVDTDGVWWVYTNPEPLVFVRHEIRLDRESGGHAFLSSGPPVGTEVVTVGVAELRGVEDEIGH